LASRKLLLGSLVATLLLGGVLATGGLNAFASGTSAAGTSSSSMLTFVDDLATKLGIPPSTLLSAIGQVETDRIQALVNAHKISAARAQKLEQKIQSDVQAGRVPLGRFLMAGSGMRHRFMARGTMLQSAATYLGISEASLLAQLRQGQSLAQIAQAEGKSVDGLTAAIVAGEKARLDQLVSAGHLTAAQETKILQNLQARVANLVQCTFPAHGAHAQDHGGSSSGATSNPNAG
jgi:hypothetical protein